MQKSKAMPARLCNHTVYDVEFRDDDDETAQHFFAPSQSFLPLSPLWRLLIVESLAALSIYGHPPVRPFHPLPCKTVADITFTKACPRVDDTSISTKVDFASSPFPCFPT